MHDECKSRERNGDQICSVSGSYEPRPWPQPRLIHRMATRATPSPSVGQPWLDFSALGCSATSHGVYGPAVINRFVRLNCTARSGVSFVRSLHTRNGLESAGRSGAIGSLEFGPFAPLPSLGVKPPGAVTAAEAAFAEVAASASHTPMRWSAPAEAT